MAASGDIQWPPVGRNRWPLTRAVGYLYFRAFTPGVGAPKRAGYDYLGTPDNSQDGTLTRWTDAFTGCKNKVLL